MPYQSAPDPRAMEILGRITSSAWIMRHSMVKIRKAEKSDLLPITEAYNSVLLEGNALFSEEPATPEEMEARLTTQAVVCVAEQDENIVGAYFLKPKSVGRGSHVAGGTYFVASAHRRLGIGTQLAQHSIEEARALGFKSMLFTGVVATNIAAVRLWQKLGFVTVGTAPRCYRDRAARLVDLHILHKEL